MSDTLPSQISLLVYWRIIPGNKVEFSQTNPLNVVASARGRPPSLGAPGTVAEGGGEGGGGGGAVISTHTMDSSHRLPWQITQFLHLSVNGGVYNLSVTLHGIKVTLPCFSNTNKLKVKLLILRTHNNPNQVGGSA